MKRRVIAVALALLLLPLICLAQSSDGQSAYSAQDLAPLMAMPNAEQTSFDYVKYGTVPHAGASSSANSIMNWFYSALKMDVEIVSATTDVGGKNLVVYGSLDSLPLSVTLAERVEALGDGVYAWGVAYEDGVLALYANSKIAFSDSEGLFGSLLESLSDFVSDGKFMIANGFSRIESITLSEYSALVKDKEEMEKQEKIDVIKEKIETEFSSSTFDKNGLGVTEDMTVESGKSYDSPLLFPEIGEHPRVLFTSDMIPGIKAALESPEYSAAKNAYESLLKKDTDGKLGAVVSSSTYSYNFSAEILNVIQARAFAYAVYGDEYYGYSAVYALLNFMNTLDYNFKQIDQTRDFGAMIYTAACVYDWCYGLLSDDIKEIIMLGVEHIACRGYVDEPEKASFDGVKLEIGFPPSKQGALTGHGCEMAILRNFLAISIAIYDEYPGWYEFCAGRFFEEYIEPRNLYYSAGMYPQGTQYNTQRFLCDLYSAALIKAISGTVPYDADGMRDTVYGLFATVTDTGSRGTFFVGDIRRTNTEILQRAGECAMLASYLFDDAILRGLAQWRENGFSKFSVGTENLTPTEFFVLASNGIGVSENGVLDTPSVIYNGGWYGQISVRESWNDGSAVALMKVQVRTTANHDHAAAGTFQIYYKGMLTGDMGDYAGDVYGSAHCKYFLRSTVAHNGLLIYDPSKQGSLEGYYVGGQRSNLAETSSLSAWLANSNYDTGEVLGYSYGYRQNGETEYAYISGDITKAYETSSASYVGRSMLTVYTGDEECPMLFFVFDRISSASADFTKKFLLQVPTSQAPTIDENGKTVEINNGKGKLLLTNIIGADKIVGYGGTDENGNRLNYQINGKQVDFVTQGVVTNRDSWGRVELWQNSGSTLGNFFNVIQLTDSDKQFSYSTEAFAACDKANADERVLEGVRVGNVAALFANSDSRVSVETAFTIPGEGYATAYVCGLYTGTWRVSVGDRYVGTVYSTNDSGMVRFTVPAGEEITLTPTSEIRPANSGEISFVTSGGSFDTAPERFYPLGEETAIPTNVTRGDDIFDGWYTDPDFSERIYSIPADAPTRLTVYAKWLNVPFLEDFSETALDESVDSNISGARYSCDKKDASSFVTDNYRGTLTWTAGEAGPHITVNSGTLGSSANLIASLADSRITVSLTLALSGDKAPQNLMIRIRDNGSLGAQNTIYLATLDGGKLYLGGSANAQVKLIELTGAMQTVNITVDFASLKLIARDADGSQLAESSLSLPAELSGKSGLDWKKCFDTELLNIRSQSAGSIIVGRIAVAEGDGSSLPKENTSNEIIYVTNGGSFASTPDTSYTPGEEKPLATDIEREGYIFLGWYTSPAFDGEPITALPEGVTGQIPLYARWVSHKIVYVTNGGSFAADPDTSYTPGETKPLATDITKSGYSFGGWYRTPDFTGEAVEALSESDFDTVTLYAKWVISGNIVVYDANGGTLTGVGTLETGEMADTYTPGTEYTLVSTVTKTGCEFLGWYTADGVRLTSFSDRSGAVYVSARWSISFISEDYSKTEIDTDGRASANGISYSNDSKSGVSFVTDKDGEYLTFTSSASGPHITATPGANTYAGMDSSLLSFTLSFAATEGADVMNFRIRVRDKGGCSAGKECDLVILYCSNGTVYLGNEKQSVKLFDITSDFNTARIVLDFKTLTLFAYSASGEVVAEVGVYVSSNHTSIDGETWQTMFKGELFNLRSAGAGSVKIGEIIVCEGNAFEN